MNTLTIARREMTSMFYSPVGYVVFGLFGLGASIFFLLSFVPGEAASLDVVFGVVVSLLVLLAPAISMRSVSEELHQGTLELLMTAPVSDPQVILGKWLGTMGFYCLLLSPLLVFIALLEIFGDPDYGPLLSGVAGLLLVGGFYLAIGVFASTLTRSQIVSFIATVFIILIFTLGMSILRGLPWIPESIKSVAIYLSVFEQFRGFGTGLLELSNIVYFVTGTALFLFIAIQTLESRRWR